MDQHQIKSTLCFIERGNVADIGRMLTWLGENCETFDLRLPPSPIAAAKFTELVCIQVGFGDFREAIAFRSHFPRA